MISKLSFISFAPAALMFGSMHLMDSLNMLSLAPGVFWIAFATTAIYYKSRELVAPLWKARQFYMFALFAILSQFILNYKLLQIHWSQDELRKTFANIQVELNGQR